MVTYYYLTNTSSSDSLVGLSLIAFGLFAFSYYTFWAVILPFLPSDHFAQSFFLGNDMVVYAPLTILIVGVALIAGFISSVLYKKANKKKST
ncbi:hypothetical protein K502DRAFT_368662 [Neoconidiobolus thromboides FSU 785]|nr:hypothetical protein K502DRAFT_368662 [Neoconidiobolus thromboides FSU 785]